MTRKKKHKFDSDTDRCICGGQWVYHEPLVDSDTERRFGYGCEKAGKPYWPPVDGMGKRIDY